jgi:hypothetical protein
VIVSASLVEPAANAAKVMPGETHVAPNDWELYACGRIEGAAAPKVSSQQSQWLKSSGLCQLKGPGAWTPYGSRPTAAELDYTPPEPVTPVEHGKTAVSPEPEDGK